MDDNTRTHGLSEANQHGLREYIRGYSLIDITNTGVIAPYKKSPAFLDNANQVVNDQKSWNRSRNQQRNWETFIQLASMITQPTILQKPHILKDQALNEYLFSYVGKATVWTFMLGAEQTSIFDNDMPAGRLADMCHKIPVITGLKENVEIGVPAFNTQGNINIYFEKAEF